MNPLLNAARDLADMDALCHLHSPVHRLPPLIKLLWCFAYILTVLSFPKYNLSGLCAMVLFPLALFSAAGLSVKKCLYRLRLILPLVCAVGIWNPLLNRQPILRVGAVVVSFGMISFLTLMLKGVFALMASYLLVATTGIEGICGALRQLHVPALLVTQLLITYRYISLLLQEAGTMVNAYSLRAPGQKGIHISAWGSFLGQLLLRSMDRAQELYASMTLRGFTGEFDRSRGTPVTYKSFVALVIGLVLIFLFRFINIPLLLGSLFT